MIPGMSIKCDGCAKAVDVLGERAVHLENRQTGETHWYCWGCRTRQADAAKAEYRRAKYPVDMKAKWHDETK